MAKRSARKRYARASSLRTRRRQGGSRWFRVTTAVVVVLGVLLIVQSRDQRAGIALPGPAANKDHWHAALGVNICGTWQPNTPAFEGNGGVHSHGEGLMHIHPFDEAHAHSSANIGTFLAGAKEGVSSTKINVGGKTYKKGDRCKNLKKDGKIRWVVNGKERTGSGDPGKYVPHNGDYITLAFVPVDYPFSQIKEPNNRSALNNITDLAPTTTQSESTSGSAPGTTESTTSPPSSTTTAPASTTTSKP